MQRIESKINIKSSDYAEQYEHNCQLMETLAARQEAVREAGKRGTQRMIERGKIPARERVELLLDPDTPFLELSTLAA
jgi:3-methylcrotonyl-CoA carboxylase beta subunit